MKLKKIKIILLKFVEINLLESLVKKKVWVKGTLGN